MGRRMAENVLAPHPSACRGSLNPNMAAIPPAPTDRKLLGANSFRDDYFTVYGRAGRPDMSVFRFIHHIAEDKPITVFGDGSQSRDFTYVDDIAAGTVAALKPLGYETINLGGDRAVVLNILIDRIAALIGKKPRIEYRPAHPADVATTWADVSKAAQLLGWKPQISIDEGIRRSVEWYFNNRDFVRSLAE